MVFEKDDKKDELEKLKEVEKTPVKKSNRGFASMDKDKQKEIASQGGKSVPATERSFSKNKDLARNAGKKGGESVPATERSFSKNKELARSAGRKGGGSNRTPSTEDRHP